MRKWYPRRTSVPGTFSDACLIASLLEDVCVTDALSVFFRASGSESSICSHIAPATETLMILYGMGI